MADSKMLTDLEEYMSCGVHIGCEVDNKFSKKYIQTYRNDKTKLINIGEIDRKLKVLSNLLLNEDKDKILVIGKKENVKKAASKFSKLTGIRTFTSRYLPGNLSNIGLKNFEEFKVVILCDPTTDKNILNEAFENGCFIASFCDTKHTPSKVDLLVPINTKGKKSLALAFYLLTKNYLISKKLINQKDFKYSIDDFSSE